MTRNAAGLTGPAVRISEYLGAPVDDTRDKVIALEVKVEQMALDMKRLADAVEHLNSLLDQAKGAKWALGFLLFVGGAMSTYLPTLVRWVVTFK